ncbi:acyltransferase family protein [Knoellia sp. LjRoot47]|uniref:acyltransferase family protein n=1 Tax=Knoellia sp. LjRoot47 TaxID=3342330 RepID=UPI003ECEDEDC
MDLSTVRDLAATTPVERNRVVDLLRGCAILVVILGHWLMAAVQVRDGGLVMGHLLALAPWTHPLTWVFQVMPVFFVVGGYANGLSWRSARRRHLPYAAWLRARLRRLLVPVVPLLLLWLVATGVAWEAGVPAATLRTASQVALVPTWFLAAYVVVCAVAPATLWLWERTGWASIAGGLVVAGLVDLVSIRADLLLVGFVNYLVVWATVSQLGYAWLDGRLAGTGRRLLLAAAGAVGTVALVRFGPYPVSMIGLDGAVVNNSYPTRVTMLTLGLLQCGLVLAVEPLLSRWMQHPRAWTATVLVNTRIMTLYLWHLTAMVLTIGALLLLGGPGLGLDPLSAGWWASRPLWWAALALVTVGAVAALGRFETPRPDESAPPPVWLPVAVTVVACAGLGLMAAKGIVGADGVHWWWPVLTVAAVGLLLLSQRRGAPAAAPSGPR